LCTVFVDKGVRKLRLTGGEPLVRKNVMWLFERLGRHLKSGALEELTLTTNGSQLSRYADDLARAGVRRINVSLDTLKPDLFAEITRWGRLTQVMEGLKAAKEAGLKVKINTVALKGVNDDELETLVAWCADEGFDITFIEVMPMGAIMDDTGADDSGREGQFMSLEEVRTQLGQRWTLAETSYRTAGPARYFVVGETGQRLGFITPLSHNFCELCNRVRLTCTGMLYMCLGQDDSRDLREVLRQSESDEALSAAIDQAILRKPKGHDFLVGRDASAAVSRHMSVTGG
ncbi:MAG: GTP 3',8-cyclase MoaA, partial [Alphaproteobacteria bacterium]|nr:GTP 3',8-cyclase MoaA [Alphaproteobacteria bacterium]